MGHSFLQAASRVVSYGWHSRDLQAQLAQARLEALRTQLHPHFLFNALNAISALVHHDPEAADRMIERLGGFLRGALAGEPGGEVPLEDELRLLGDYLRLEELRFCDRLTTRIEAAPDARRALVPGGILQPLVENAVRAAVEDGPGPAKIVIRAVREDGQLRLEIRGVPGAVSSLVLGLPYRPARA